jgi:hypothetical protein
MRALIAVMTLAVGLVASGSAFAAEANHQGLWWNAQESGWGINLAHQGDIVFATWFTYGADNKPQWYTIRADRTAANVYAGPVSSFTGPPFSSVPFPPNVNVKTAVGTATLTFAADGRSAAFSYTVNGITQTKQIVPQEFSSPVPTCIWGVQPDLTLATNYQDLWWVTNGDESGWGINFTHQGKVIFATWFTYDVDGKGWWLFTVATETAVPKVYSGLVKVATGPPFSAEPFDANAVIRTSVGNATITIVDGSHATFDYTVNGTAQTKHLSRQVFVPPGTACSSTAVPTATAVGAPTGSAASATIGTAGGSVSAPDGKLVVTIPAGALAASTAIGVQPITNLAHGRIGAAYRLTPSGQTFLKPVTLTFAYGEQDLLGTAPEFLGAAFQTGTGHWRWAGDATVDTTAKTVRVGTSHFSDWSNVKGIQIRPAKKSVRVKGSVGLEVKICYQTAVLGATGDELTSLAFECDSDDELAILNVVDQWSVNGVPGGTGATGTVSGNGVTGTYVAPATKPSPNTVAVSARVDRGAQGKTLVVSNITIVEDTWKGTGSLTTDGASFAAQVTWTLDSEVNNIATYKPAGIVTATYCCGCSINPPTVGNLVGVLIFDYNTNPPTYHGSAAAAAYQATITCEDGGTSDVLTTSAPWFGGNGGPFGGQAAGAVSADGTTIEGTDSTIGTFVWKFTRDQ